VKKLFVFAVCMAIASVASAQLLDNLDTPGDPPPGWTKFQAGWGSMCTVTGGATHNAAVCTGVDLAGNNGSSGMVRPWAVSAGQVGDIIVDISTGATGTLWIETGYIVYAGDPGPAAAGAAFDGMPGYPGGNGHGVFALIVKFDSWGLGQNNGDTWSTYTTSACAGTGGSCPLNGPLTVAAGEDTMYIGMKVGNDGWAYYDTLSTSGGLPVEDWFLY
jgi:hypothetical protein